MLSLQFGLDVWLQKTLSPPVAEVTPRIRPRMVRLRLKSKPEANLVELLGKERIRRGRTPLDLDWLVKAGASDRAFVLEKKGYVPTPLTVRIPSDDGKDPQLVKLNVTLLRR